MKQKCFVLCLLVLCLLVVTTGLLYSAEKTEAKGKADQEFELINPMDMPDWQSYVDKTVSFKMKVVPGKVGNALELTYDFKDGNWCAIFQPQWIDLSNYSGMRFWYKGEGKSNSIEVKLVDNDGSSFGKLLDTKSNESKWTKVEIPFSEFTYWWGGNEELDFKYLQIHFAISTKEELNDEGGAGKVIIDGLEGIKGKLESKSLHKVAVPKDVIDTMDSIIPWKVYKDEKATIKPKSVGGKVGNALELSYDFTSGGTWCAIFRSAGDISAARGIRFVYRGEGDTNTLEVKLEDGDGSNFGKTVDTKTNPGSWTTVEIPFSDFTYWWGEDQNLNLKKINLHFAVSIREGDNGGSGKVIIDQVEVMR